MGQLLLVIVFVVAMTPTTLANPPVSCHVDRMYLEATHIGQIGNHKGIRSDVLKPPWNNDCVRISAVNVLSGFNGFVEWGVSLGWLFDTEIGGSCPSSVYHDQPERFVVWRPINGSVHCRPNEGTLTSGNRKNFSLRDTDQNETWGYYFEGVQNGTVDVNFSRGTVVTNAERHRLADIGYAEFYNIQLLIAGDSTWYNFNLTLPAPVSAWDQDPEYNCIQVTTNDEEVRQQPRTC
jgi:hypothetical protein